MSLLAALLAIVADWRAVSPTAHLSPRRAPSPGFAGLPGPALPDPHHLDQRRPAAQLERRVLSPLALLSGSHNAVRGRPPPCPGLLSRPPGRRGPRRYPLAQDRPLDPPGVLSTRSSVAAVSCQSDAGLALPASFPAGAVAPARPGGQRALPIRFEEVLAVKKPSRKKPVRKPGKNTKG